MNEESKVQIKTILDKMITAGKSHEDLISQLKLAAIQDKEAIEENVRKLSAEFGDLQVELLKLDQTHNYPQTIKDWHDFQDYKDRLEKQ